MSDYISREDALDAMGDVCGIADAEDRVRALPAADVRETKLGEWIYKNIDHFYTYSLTCPFCKAEYVDNVWDGYVSVESFNFCPNCGADMREQ